MEELKNIGEEIRKRRKMLGIIQPELADIAGVSLRSLIDIENGTGNPTLVQIMKLLDALGLKIKIVSKYEYD